MKTCKRRHEFVSDGNRGCRKCRYLRKVKYTRQQRYRLRIAVIKGYGNRCNCLGCPNPYKDYRFLTLDHVNSDGVKERRGKRGGDFKAYKRAVKEGFPPDLQILCWDCNCARSTNNGICPHMEQ